MLWQSSHRADPRALALADRHYNRQKVGTPQFVPPGRCVVLYSHTMTGRAFWVTSWPFGQYVKHAWPGFWVCSAFRNEGAGQASTLIRQALAATRHVYGDTAPGLVTFIDRSKVRPTRQRGRDVWGWTYLQAGFRQVEDTKGGLAAFVIDMASMPPAQRSLMELEAAA